MTEDFPPPGVALQRVIDAIDKLIDAKIATQGAVFVGAHDFASPVANAREQLRRDFATMLAMV